MSAILKTTTAFRARAHLLKLLGDELIGDDRLAIFELVKNSYDADATSVDVLLDLESSSPRIVVTDFEGHGMTERIILDKWMEIGTDSKRKDRKRSQKFKRMPLGEKGVGRLAVHKLGSELILNTRAKNNSEYKIQIYWPTLIGNSAYIEDTEVIIQTLPEPEYFLGKETGTRIEIRDLNKTNWTRGDIRRLKRLLTSLVSPFSEVSDFNVNLLVPGREKDLKDILEAEDILDRAIWSYDFIIDKDGIFTYEYKYNPPSVFRSLKSRVDNNQGISFELLPPTKSETASRSKDSKNKLLLNSDDLEDIGPIHGKFYVYLRERDILNASGAYQSIRSYLDEQTGIRVYRDGIRVFNYGEPNEDWLGLNAGRINRPGKKIGTNMVIGGIELDLENSKGLSEKTNREGFDDNDCFKRFKLIVQSAVDYFHLLHVDDRDELAKYIKKGRESKKPDPTEKFNDTINDIRKGLSKHGLETELGGKVDQIESNYLQMRDVTLSTGIAGINLAVIFHEVERGIDDLNRAIKSGEKQNKLIERSEHLSKLLEGFAPLLKRNEQKSFSVKNLVARVLDLSEHRFEHHKVTVSCPLMIGESPDFMIKGPFGLFQAAINNLIDNAIHWTRIRAEKEDNNYKSAIKILTLLDWFQEGPALVIADNGPGFSLEPEDAVMAFKTTRPGGMGLGLYYSNMVMETVGGRLLIMSPDELELPAAYSGAAIVMIFKKEKS